MHLPLDGQCDPCQHRHGARQGRPPERGARVVEERQGHGRACSRRTAAFRACPGRAMAPSRGTIEACEMVVNCGGMWGRDLAAQLGRDAAAACLRAFLHRHRGDPGASPRLPVLRVPDECAYYKEDAGKMLLGAFEPKAKPWGMEGIREDVLLRPAPRGLRPFRADPRDGGATACRCWNEVGIHTFFNGPESFTPDDRYYLGEAPEVKGYFDGGRLQLDRHRFLGRRRHGARAVDERRRAALRPLGGRHPPRPAIPEEPHAT